MALCKVVFEAKANKPYYKPPPLHVNVVLLEEQERVVSWDFSQEMIGPKVKKMNTVAITYDGHSVAKITLFEEFAHNIASGRNYLLRGYSLRGSAPPYYIFITRGTQFFRSSPVAVPDGLKEEATRLLHPPSVHCHIRDLAEGVGLVTIEGKVVGGSAARGVTSRTEEIPLRTLTLKQEESTVEVNLWREAALFTVDLGKDVGLSHLQMRITPYGKRLQSTQHTKMTSTSITSEATGVLVTGVLETANQGLLELVLSTKGKFFIDNALWQPLEDHLFRANLVVDLEFVGNKVVAIRRVATPPPAATVSSEAAALPATPAVNDPV